VLVAEQRVGPAPLAAFKVGESTVDVSSHYFGEILGLWDHLEERHVYKAGLRFFFPAGANEDIARRIEFGPTTIPLPIPAYQLDRGLFENELAARNRAAGVDVLDGCVVEGVDLDEHGHSVHLARSDEPRTVNTRWVIDASGRAGLLKKKLGLAKMVDHKVNASWLRLAGGLDLEEWSDDPGWRGHMSGPGIRRQSTTHLMGEGYWVWLIPLGTGPISIGIVADPRFHPFAEIASLEAALDWLVEHEPQLAAALRSRRTDVEDFLRVEDFSFSAERVISPQRWALTGEAGVFADPLYSPGSDFIAYGNSYIADLVLRDLAGEQITGRAEAYNGAFLAAFDAALYAYVDHYSTMGNPQVMAAKIAWDHAWYWAINALRFMAGRLCDLDGMASFGPSLLKAVALTARMQDFFREWHALDDKPQADAFIDVAPFPQTFQADLASANALDTEAFAARLAENVEILEAMAVVLFHEAARRSAITLPDDARIDPYAITLDHEHWDAAGLFKDSGTTLEAAQATVGDLANLRLDGLAAT
jgi:flavin-dependent dehydrogenase